MLCRGVAWRVHWWVCGSCYRREMRGEEETYGTAGVVSWKDGDGAAYLYPVEAMPAESDPSQTHMDGLDSYNPQETPSMQASPRPMLTPHPPFCPTAYATKLMVRAHSKGLIRVSRTEKSIAITGIRHGMGFSHSVRCSTPAKLVPSGAMDRRRSVPRYSPTTDQCPTIIPGLCHTPSHSTLWTGTGQDLPGRGGQGTGTLGATMDGY